MAVVALANSYALNAASMEATVACKRCKIHASHREGLADSKPDRASKDAGRWKEASKFSKAKRVACHN